ncbi:haloacid dehalogenase-like hydrolase domain-containing 5 [Periophthalmus magnuspinnatus]|uniref:haloacid dehalogenase-like hydrolase domain-containing 5 n=1 Tax=Periophthalmus magnuspinnatus TaxID=409849 RepID=UPI002436931E|nr:haloacid dehalogenase-like hydrolase domain-containing 5 [Periophthalmus magnuspinnatus]
MWSRAGRQFFRHLSCGAPQAGLLLDVDGVLVRGRSVVPAARRAFKKLQRPNKDFIFPVVFVTNAGSCHREQRANQLSDLLHVQVHPEQVVLSYSPLTMMKSLHHRVVLVSGQGPIREIAHRLGFDQIVTIDDVRKHCPLLDAVDHDPRPAQSALQTLPRIQGILLFGEPTHWESHLQIMIDVILTNGNPGSAHLPPGSTPQLPIIICNPDLLWKSHAPSPRFGHGVFVLCLEAVFKKLSGVELQIEALLGKPSVLTYRYAEHLLTSQMTSSDSRAASRLRTIYAIGDNPLTDVYGANLYDRFLKHNAVTAATAPRRVSMATGKAVSITMGGVPEEEEGLVSGAEECRSVLVCTGVFDPASPPSSDQWAGLEAELLQPRHTVEDVEEAVELILQREGLLYN